MQCSVFYTKIIYMQYSQISPEFKAEFFKLVEESNHILITAHISPDEDAIASVLSMYAILTTTYPAKSIRIAISSEPQDRLKMFKNYEKIEFVNDIANHLADTDLLIMLDGSQYHRFSKDANFGEQMSKIKSICIDHHSSPIDNFTLSLVVPELSSNAELIYLSITEKENVTSELAEVFILGILADTGNFSYLKKGQTGTLATAKELMDMGDIQIEEFQSQYRHTSTREFQVLKELVKNTVNTSIPGWPPFQYTFVSEEFAKDYTEAELSGGKVKYQGHYLRRIEGYPWGFVITPRDGSARISARSMNKSVNVRALLEKMGIGGGHDRAAGGEMKDTTVSDAINKIKGWMEENKAEVS